ncbi:MAG: glycosyltransferase [Methylococcales bacterium]|nr:glycosyltransferase [Methylococcales bacterium]
MKILFVHNFYQQAGGEDTVLAAEMALLKRHDHEVRLWSMDNKNLPAGLGGKIRTACNTVYSRQSRVAAGREIAAFRPDVVHVHNFFPQISPSIYDACLDAGVPVVQTLHNYRMLCAGAMLMRAGRVCEQCIGGSPYQAVKYGCYRGSRLGSLVLAHLIARQRRQKTWHHKVTRFIALTEFAKSRFVSGGFPADNIVVKPNFAEPPESSVSTAGGERFGLYVGRISPEKGIDTLLSAWRQLDRGLRLKVAGDGPLLDRLQAGGNVEFLGRQTAAQVGSLMSTADFLVLPSEWYEGFPMVLVEAFAHGLPVLASRLGSMADIIQDGENGLLFNPGDVEDLRQKLEWMQTHSGQIRKMGQNAKLGYLANYTPEENYRQLLGIYAEAMAGLPI